MARAIPAQGPVRTALLLLPPLLLLACGGTPPPAQPPPPPDAGAGQEQVPDAGRPAVEPLEGPAHSWKWVPFLRSRCMSGGPAGLALNLSPGSDRLLLFLEGGGACFDPVTCAVAVDNADGYGEADFAEFEAGLARRGVFDREAAANPFRDWNYVYVPYCSGDVHAGDNPSGWQERMHLGARNLELFLERVVPTFPGLRQVVLAGSSAGGVGAALNFDRVQQAFGDVEVVLLDDSGAVFSDTYMKPCLQQLWREAWNLEATLPADCTPCRPGPGGLVELTAWLAQRYPHRRFGLILSTRDEVFRNFFGFGYSPACDTFQTMPAEEFAAGVAELRDVLLAPYPNFHLYTPDSTKHVYLHDRSLSATVVSGVPLSEWLRQLVEGDAAWQTVRP